MVAISRRDIQIPHLINILTNIRFSAELGRYIVLSSCPQDSGGARWVT